MIERKDRRICHPLTIAVMILVLAVSIVTAGSERHMASNLGKSVTRTPTWPTLRGALATDSVYSMFDCFGQFGFGQLPGIYTEVAEPWEYYGFSSPRHTKIDYLSSMSLCVGGVIGSDTLAAMGGISFLPPGYAYKHLVGDIVPIVGPADQCYWAHYTDTLHKNSPGPSYGGTLNIAVSQRSYAWQSGTPANCLLYDLTITNIGTETIKAVYLGFQADPDLCPADDTLRTWSYKDDLTGSIPGENICYAIDNDGDPRHLTFPSDTSPSRAFGFKLLAVSSPPRDTCFNWAAGWFETNNYGSFGPRRHDETWVTGPRGSGSMSGDTSQYNWMRTKGWDYDQVMIGTIGRSDSIWCFPQADTVAKCAYGSDARFLYSFGPYDLPPDSSLRLVMTTFTGGEVHSDPHILDFIRYAPELYRLSLDFSGLITSAHVADSLASLVWDADNPPTGLRVIGQAGDSVVIEWDPWVLDNIEGCNLYLAEIPNSAYQHPGVPPPQYLPSELPAPIELGREHGYVFRHLDAYRSYTCLLANRYGGSIGKLSTPLTFRPPNGPVKPVPLNGYSYISGQPVTTVRWEYADSTPLAGFNIYRYPDSISAAAAYLAFYSINQLDLPVVDSLHAGIWQYYFYSLTPYGTVPSTSRSFVDSAACDKCVYLVTAVDTANFESPFSAPIYTKQVQRKTRDILVLTSSGTTYSWVTTDTLKNFYSSLLAGYDYDIFMYFDSITAGDCLQESPYCFDWYDFTKYRLVIIDDGIRDILLSSTYEQATKGFSHYAQSGGTLACFGSLGSVGQQLSPTLKPGIYDRPLPLAKNLLGVDSVLFMGSLYYRIVADTPWVDTVLGFSRAEAVAANIPSIEFDLARSPFIPSLEALWPKNTPPSASAFVTKPQAHITHVFRSLYPDKSICEGRPVGLMTKVGDATSFVFGFHLWYMVPEQARNLVDWIMQNLPTSMDAEIPPALPRTIMLSQNYPNPFNGSTSIDFELPTTTRVTLDIFNILGQHVTTLLDGVQAAGRHRVTWSGGDVSGKAVASGMYLYRLRTDQRVLTAKMLLLK